MTTHYSFKEKTMTTLYITSSARQEDSNSRILGQHLIDQLGEKTIERDLATNPLPLISAQDLIAVHGSTQNGSAELDKHLALSNTLIEELQQADVLVIASPMYNFSIPSTLKQWIDMVCRAGVTFKYTEKGPQGLVNIKNAYIITASGGTPLGSNMDFASGYLELICTFLGVEKIHHIDANGSKRKTQQIIEKGKAQINSLTQ